MLYNLYMVFYTSTSTKSKHSVWYMPDFSKHSPSSSVPTEADARVADWAFQGGQRSMMRTNCSGRITFARPMASLKSGAISSGLKPAMPQAIGVT